MEQQQGHGEEEEEEGEWSEDGWGGWEEGEDSWLYEEGEVNHEKVLKPVLNPLMPNRYNCTYVLFLFLRFNCCKKQIRTLLNHTSTIVSIEINHFVYELNQ